MPETEKLLSELQDWLREPDHAEAFNTKDILNWLDRRPTHIVPKVLAALSTPPIQSGEQPRPDDVERVVSTIREWLLSTDHPVSQWECDFAAAVLTASSNDAQSRDASGPPYASDNWDVQGYKSPADEIDDMANVGRSLMDAIACNKSHPLLKHWAPADDPAEIVTDLLNAFDEKGRDASGDDVERPADPLMAFAREIAERDDSLGDDARAALSAIQSRDAGLREALREAAETLAWAGRVMKGNCQGRDIDAVNLAAGRAKHAALSKGGDRG